MCDEATMVIISGFSDCEKRLALPIFAKTGYAPVDHVPSIGWIKFTLRHRDAYDLFSLDSQTKKRQGWFWAGNLDS